MEKKFNVTGKCIPEQHYMVDIDSRLNQIKMMIDQKEYFCINRARQYGKTTMLSLLKRKLQEEYIIFAVSFEGIGEIPFKTEETFAYTFVSLLKDGMDYGEVKYAPNEMAELINETIENGEESFSLLQLSRLISRVCVTSLKPIVLFIDEVDCAGNHESFMNFLGMLRDKYMNREVRPTFQSVVLAGVYDIKNLKLKIRSNVEHQYNSPWNIAAEFDVNMDFDREDIKGMLRSYETDFMTGMDISSMSDLLYEYTSGYPFLVSRLCKLMDEKVAGTEAYPLKSHAWTKNGFLEAVKLLLLEQNTLFDDMRKQISEFPDIRNMLYELLYEGHSFPYNVDDKVLNIAIMFGYIKEFHGKVMVSNRIFETRLYNLFASEERMQSAIYTEGSKDKRQFIQNGRLDMKRVLERFVVHFGDLYGDKEARFVERIGRKIFLFYLMPIINGTGNYYVEAQTRDEGRTDVIVDYGGEQYVVELKIWHGDAYKERGEEQLLKYLEAYHLDQGYMLSFNFNKRKTVGVHEIQIGCKKIIEAIV